MWFDVACAMRSLKASGHGAVLVKTLSARQQSARRWLIWVVALLGLALASGVLSALLGPSQAPVMHAAATGPFSYFPS